MTTSEDLGGPAPVAIQAGRHAGEQVARRIEGQPLTPFRYRDKGMMAVLGRGDAVAELSLQPGAGAGAGSRRPLRFGGLRMGALARRPHRLSDRNRLKVLVDWGMELLHLPGGPERSSFGCQDPCSRPSSAASQRRRVHRADRTPTTGPSIESQWGGILVMSFHWRGGSANPQRRIATVSSTAASSTACRSCRSGGMTSRSPARPSQETSPVLSRTRPDRTYTVASPGFSCSANVVPAVNAISVCLSICSCPPYTVSALRPALACRARSSCSRASASSDSLCIEVLRSGQWCACR